jgi:hypothetical protein
MQSIIYRAITMQGNNFMLKVMEKMAYKVQCIVLNETESEIRQKSYGLLHVASCGSMDKFSETTCG